MGLAMPNLNLLMSIGTFLLIIFWFITPGFKAGIERVKQNQVAVLLIGILLLHLVWLVNTQNFEYAFKDIRIKSPLLVFGLVLGSVDFTRSQVKLFFLSLSIGVWVASAMSYINYFQAQMGVYDFRDVVTGISHIRLSLIMVTLVAGILNFWKSFSLASKIYYAIVFLNVIIFFQVIQSLTGVLSLGILLLFSLFVFTYRSFGRRAFILTGGAFVVVIILASIYTLNVYHAYFSPVEKISELKDTTVNGNEYLHRKSLRIVENGHYLYMNVCEPELIEAWNSRSDLKIDSEGKNKNIRNCLGRYLTSKGYTKDSLGVMQLSEQDVKNIEAGYPSEVYIHKTGLPLRLHSFLFAYHVYSQTGYATGYSFFQRLVYWQAALEVIKDHTFFGVGTGDVKDAFQKVYERADYNLDEQYWLRAHNQFLTFFVSFGVFGMAYFIFFFAETFRHNRRSYLGLAVTLLAILSCITEDTLETQAGVAFFGFFIALFSNRDFAE